MSSRRGDRVVALLSGLIAIAGLILLTAPPASAATPTPTAAAATTTARPRPVVLVGTGGISWRDVGDTTATLASLRRDAAVGWLAVRSVRPPTCPVDGWLAVSAGRRAADPRRDCPAPEIAVTRPGAEVTVPRWQEYLDAASGAGFGARPGLLADTLAAGGRSAAAVGPGAALALAGRNGTVRQAWAGGTGEALAADVRSALVGRPDLLVVDVGAVREPTAGAGATVAQQVQAVDARIGAVLREVTAAEPDATVVVASLADAGRRAQLQLVAATGLAPGSGDRPAGALLGSSSTRQDALAQSTDLLPTLLAAVGLSTPVQAVGAPLRPVRQGDPDRLKHLDDVEAASRAATSLIPGFYKILVAGHLLFYALVALLLRRPRPGRLGALRIAAVLLAAAPGATYLANLLPWWRSSTPGVTLTADVVLFSVALAAPALLGPWRRAPLGPMAVLGGETALVLGIDACTGSNLGRSSLLGSQPVVAGRFYGFGNIAFALFATGAVLLALGLTALLRSRGHGRLAPIAVAAVGVVAVVVDATPGLGTDFGGPPAVLPAFAVLCLLTAGVRLTWRRMALVAGATVVTLLAVSVGDWLRPPADQTHLGRFVQNALDGGMGDILRRKARSNLRLLVGSWLSALAPVAVVFWRLVLSRPLSWAPAPVRAARECVPELGPGAVALGTLLGLGAALNDSGIVIVSAAVTLGIPLLVALALQALSMTAARPE